MWGDGDKAAQPWILHNARIDRRNCGPITMAEQKTAFEPDSVQNLGQYPTGLLGHIIQRSRQSGRLRATIARPRIGADPPARGGAQTRGKVAPKIARAQPLMQQHHSRRVARRWPVTAIFQPLALRLQQCRPCPPLSHARARSLKRWIFPVAVFGSSSMISIQRGYFHFPILSLINIWISATSSGP